MSTPRENLLKIFRHERPDWIPVTATVIISSWAWRAIPTAPWSRRSSWWTAAGSFRPGCEPIVSK